MVPWSSKGATGRVAPAASAAPSPALVMAAPTTTVSSLNGPDSPPVVYNPYEDASSSMDYDEEDERCRACHAAALYTDWPQGDRVCTNCGVVAEGHLRETKAEWKDFNEAEDIVKGLPSGARSGLVAVDESRYIGGLQPTTLSKHAFGGETNGGYGTAMIRKRLKATNKKLDYMMEKIHSKALKEAKLDRHIRLKRSREERDNVLSEEGESSNDIGLRPEMDNLVLQEEEDAQRLHTTLYAEKWSLDRAILLYGQAHEQRHATDEEREDLHDRLDHALRRASQNLYTAYSMMSRAADTLQLPERVKMEASHRLVRFATRKDGFKVAGVASRLSKDSTGTLQEKKAAAEHLKEYNICKQMAAVGAALLFLTARSLGWTRSPDEVSASFVYRSENNILGGDNDKKSPAFIKGKHISRVLKEIQAIFPEYGRGPATTSTDRALSSNPIQNAAATANFAEHTLQRLRLPPVAEACICKLLVDLRNKQQTLGELEGVKLQTLCAGIAYLVCHAGSAMQRLAQVHQESVLKAKESRIDNSLNTATSEPAKKKTKTQHDRVDEPVDTSSDDDDDALLSNRLKDKDVTPFDVFSHAAVTNNDTSETESYELKRMWDAWVEQMSWDRSIIDLEQSCGVSRNVIVDFYKTELYPQRAKLLKVLADASQKSRVKDEKVFHPLHDTPLASTLLGHIVTAASVMSSKR